MGKKNIDPIYLRLLYANKESEITEIIGENADMANSDNWRPVDNRDTNNNVITNQQSSGGKAATELITNMVDAMLTKCCWEKGIDPKSADAPKTMYQAVDKFFTNLNGGKIINADGKFLQKYAERNLIIGIVGSNKAAVRPCYVFCDNGEGQHPKDFPDTFLSLSAKHKSEISFVQGKYNMGSSGVLTFCGKCWYKLILSRRHDKSGKWGWTLIRKREVSSGLPYAEYYAPNGNIQTIEDKHICPFKTKKEEVYKSFSLSTGTIVKLYEYYTGKSHGGYRSARDAFNENLVETILPFRIWDFRFDLPYDARSLYGMEFLLFRGHKEGKSTDDADMKSEDKKIFHIDKIDDRDLGKIVITAIKLNKKFNLDTNSRVFHHVNGQVQFKNTRGFLSQCKLPALKDRVVIFVDSSALKDGAHLDIWKGDRENIRETSVGEQYKEIVKQSISKSEILKQLNHQVVMNDLAAVAKDSSRELVQDMVNRDENLALLLEGKIPDPDILTPDTGEQSQDKLRDDLKPNPTYIKLIKGRREYEIQVKGSAARQILCDTDAPNDFLTRSKNCGNLLFNKDGISDKFQTSTKLDNGKLILSLRSESDVKEGDEFKFKILLDSEEMPSPVFTEEVTVKIIPSLPKSPRTPIPKKPPATKKDLPKYQLLTKKGYMIGETSSVKWEDSSFRDCKDHDGGIVVDDTGDGKLYLINYDNASFQNYWRSQKSNADKKMVSEKYILGMRILMLGLEHALSVASGDTKNKSEEFEEFKEEFRRMSAKGAAMVVLTLCDQLPKRFDIRNDSDSTDED